MKYKTKKDELTLKHMAVYPVTKFPNKPLTMGWLAKKARAKNAKTVTVRVNGDW